MIKNKFLTILITFGATLVFLVSAGPVYAVPTELLGRVYKGSVGINCTRSQAPQYNNQYYLGTSCDGTGLPGTSAACNGAPDYTITWSQPSNGKSGSLGANECDSYMAPNTYAPRYVTSTALSQGEDDQPEGDPAGITTTIAVDTTDLRYKITEWAYRLTDDSGYTCHVGGDPNGALQLINGAFPTPNQTQSVTLSLFSYDEDDGVVTHTCNLNHVWFASATDPIGNLDSATCSLASGWACDPDNFNQAINVDLYTVNYNVSPAQYAPLGSTNANINNDRQDVANMCGGNKAHEFSFNIPNTSQDLKVNLKDGASHEIHAFGIDINAPPDGNKELFNSPLSITCPAPTGPTNPTLRVYNSSSSQTGTFTQSYNRTSGNQNSQGGSNWLNPMAITLSATPGTAPISKYYVAFYNKSVGTAYPSIIDASGNPTASLQTLLSNDRKQGFVLRYDSGGTYYVWDPSTSTWTNITGNTLGKQICGSAGCLTQLYYTAYPGNTLGVPSNPNLAQSWNIKFDKNFASKNMYTAVYVIDSTPLSVFQADITPNP